MKMTTTVKNAALDGSDFAPGLREYFEYRDTGVKEATGGMYAAHVIRAVAGKEVEPLWHTHTVGFQLFFVLQGWVEFEYEDIGVVRLEKGGSAFQPPNVRHRELRHSDDLEVLEIVSPAAFATSIVEEK
ncbi:cupin domain-containing protein [Paraburkholderia panacisoli]|uniref:Cupin domain-containing protein n=1 Tax=Paraburkholderia panacisoli TaxID=2603818 RepID=A0A5B0G6Y4_9BURK|nr:cupin domain-containing protein [Paraburkholderia panacisoli]KAA0999136.1 cupin domain-containing protein [Paraburkholderia panacisoli]